ncbi:monovalent cation/H(+) antiporter subunit G [Gellertiella hungarica]|uniref:Multicomponent Na+:H+ antiporter subunit G n=1 Tax=Gellertiella hungarica TaxID=1572859 RepID=A0A7W6J6M9_9HYPH|nr:monovalent cation/H(+) antiporter subunit G [Gellertiella hungarica]MBB4065759.1 multicomponent Na+:H+ antiporter subunit G [Gellertiella hungarica]
MTAAILDYATVLLILAGSFFTLAAAIGILRLPDLFTRMHAASKAGAVGAGLLLIAAGIHTGDAGLAARAVAGFFFLILTSPVSAHLLARAFIVTGNRPDLSRLRHRNRKGEGDSPV